VVAVTEPKSGSKKVQAAVYDRVSVEDKRSQAEHLERCRAYCKSRGWDVVLEKAETESGFKRVERPGWQAIRKAVEAGEVDAVVAFAVSRTGRNLAAFTDFLQACRDHDVVFASVTEDLSTAGPFGPVIYSMLSGIAELESQAKSERAQLGRKANDREGYWSGGYRPFGFDVEETEERNRLGERKKHVVVRKDEAALIRKAATDVLNGVSLATIARRWNDKGVTTTGGKSWTKGHVKQVLGAERNIPEVLTRSDHSKVVKMFDGRRTGRAGERYMLTGILECGRCGGSMQGRMSYDGEKQTPKYICLATGTLHLSATAAEVNQVVVDAAAERPERKARKAQDPSAELVQEREKLVREQEMLGEAPPKGWSEARIAGRDRALSREIEELDRQIEEAQPRGFYSEMYRKAEEFDERAWLEGLVEKVTLRAGKPGNRFDPERVSITWK
jgi:DNA invertase Pin-like site-specific DNA recombinase